MAIEKATYKAGDIVRIKPTGIPSKIALKLLNLFITPRCDFFHHAIIRTPIPDESDYEIQESINSGVREGRLSWYKDYEVYRLRNRQAVAKGKMACAKFSRHGRAGYDYIRALKIGWSIPIVVTQNLIKEHRFRKIRCSEIPYARDSHFICTELAYEITYLQGKPILPPDVVSLPNSIQEVIDKKKKLKRVLLEE